MSDDLSAVHELLADLRRRIAEEETATRARCDRLSEYRDADQLIRDEWDRFKMSVAPMRQHIDSLVKALATAREFAPSTPFLLRDRLDLSELPPLATGQSPDE